MVGMPSLSNPESVMNEVEYDCLLDAVRMAIAPASEESTFNQSPKVANDNHMAWPLTHFRKAGTELGSRK
jgi:hypothetical protein